MKKSVIYVLTLISLTSFSNAGVIRNINTCVDAEGNEIPCKKLVEKAEDILGHGIDLSKRNLEDRTKSWWNLGDWWNKVDKKEAIRNNPFDNVSSGNVIPTSNAVPSNKGKYDYGSLKHGKKNNKGDFFSWLFGNGLGHGKGKNRISTITYINANGEKIVIPQGAGGDIGFGDIGFGDIGLGGDIGFGDDIGFGGGQTIPTEIGFGGGQTIPPEIGLGGGQTIPPEIGLGGGQTIPPDIGLGGGQTIPPDIGFGEQTNPPATGGPDSKPPATTNSPATGGSSDRPGNLPIKNLAMTNFRGCNTEQTKAMNNLIEDIKTYRAAALYVLKNQSEDENYRKIFLKHFKDMGVLSRVTQTFNNVNEITEAEAYCEDRFDSACMEGAIAWTYVNSNQFHVCPEFFNTMFGTIKEHKSEAASIILHELTHCRGTDDFAYGEAACAALDANRASNNADTFRLFSMSSIYYLNDKNGNISKRSIDDFLNEKIDFRVEPFKDKLIIRSTKTKRDAIDDILNESIDFREEPLVDKVINEAIPEGSVYAKRDAIDDILNGSIDFREEPLVDKVINEAVPEGSVYAKRDAIDDILNGSIDFREEPLVDKVINEAIPEGNVYAKRDAIDDILNGSIDFREEPLVDKVINEAIPEGSVYAKRDAIDDILNESIDFREEPLVDKVINEAVPEGDVYA